MLHREIGDNVICDMPQSNEDIVCVLTTIQLGQSPEEFGSATNSHFDCFIKELKELKATVNRGITSHEISGRKFSKICFLHPLVAARCISETLPDIASPNDEKAVKHDDWIDAGSRAGLPLKAHREWREGRRHHASHEEWKTRRAALRDMKNDMKNNSPAKKARLAWIKGETCNTQFEHLEHSRGELLMRLSSSPTTSPCHPLPWLCPCPHPLPPPQLLPCPLPPPQLLGQLLSHDLHIHKDVVREASMARLVVHREQVNVR